MKEGKSPTDCILKENRMYRKEKEQKKRKQKTGETSSLSDNIGHPCFHWVYRPLFCSMDDQGKLPLKGVYTLGHPWVIIVKYP
jgi:hypothetical protein